MLFSGESMPCIKYLEFVMTLLGFSWNFINASDFTLRRRDPLTCSTFKLDSFLRVLAKLLASSMVR